MTWENEQQFDDHRAGIRVTVGVDLDGDIGILCQDGRRKGQEFSIIIAGHEALALSEHLKKIHEIKAAKAAKEGDDGNV